MNIDDTVLLAYADDELPEAERRDVERAIAQSSDMAERLAALRASVLPYRAAFDGQKLPEVPPALVKHLDDLLRAQNVGLAPKTPNNQPVPMWLALQRKLEWYLPNRALYLASFAAGVFCMGIAFGIALNLWPDQLGGRSQLTLAQAVAQYHDFYGRETVMNVAVDAAADKATLADALKADGLPVKVPDLSSAGLVFKRIQRLRFNDQPLLQIVYLPERGGPVALCITLDNGADAALQSRQLGRLQTISWRQNSLASVLVGAQSQIDLHVLAARIAKGELPPLYPNL